MVHEPDNGKNNFLGWVLQNGSSRFPYYRTSEPENKLIELFRLALGNNIPKSGSKSNSLLFKFAGANKNTIEKSLHNRGIYKVDLPSLKLYLSKLLTTKFQKNQPPILVKSVHSLLSIPYLKKYLDFEPVIILRHPCAVIHSMKTIGMPDINRHIYKNKKLRDDYLIPHMPEIYSLKSDLEFAGLQIGIFHMVLKKFVDEYGYFYITHENLVNDPIANYKSVFEHLNLEWDKTFEEKLQAKNKPGSGYAIQRELNTVNEVWKSKLNHSEIKEIAHGYNIFPELFYREFQS